MSERSETPADRGPTGTPLATDLSRRYFVSLCARRWDGGGYRFNHSVGVVYDCDSEAEAHAHAWAVENAERRYPTRAGWIHDIITIKAYIDMNTPEVTDER